MPEPPGRIFFAVLKAANADTLACHQRVVLGGLLPFMTKQVRVEAIRGLADRDERGPAHRRCPAYHRHDTTLEAAKASAGSSANKGFTEGLIRYVGLQRKNRQKNPH